MNPSGYRSGEWVADPGFGVYVHIPFCRHRCHYCDFNTYAGQDALIPAYVDALEADIRRWSDETSPATSVFFGGGTPTLLEADDLARLLGAIEDVAGFASGAEVTIEANPETVDERKFAALLDAGFNRFSIGVQSLQPHVLEALGRTHSAEVALEALRAARSAGAEDVNLDVIYGSVWESDDDWERTITGVIAAAPDHISAYALTIEPGTPLGAMVSSGRVRDVDPDVQARRYGRAAELLDAAGYVHYEVSNWCRPGNASRHNVLYWCGGDYLAFGAGAHGHVGGRRWWNVKLPRVYIDRVAAGASTEAGFEIVPPVERASEALMLGLRLLSGIESAGFSARFGPGVLERPGIKTALDQGLLRSKRGRLAIAPDYVFLGDGVAARL